MNTKKRKPPMSRTTLWATAVVLSLIIALGPAQNSFASNTPVTPVDQQGATGGGGGSGPIDQAESDGGGGATGPIERIAQFQITKTPTSTRFAPGKDGGVSGSILLEWVPMGYYELVFDMFYLQYMSDGSQLTSHLGAKYE